MNFSISGVVNVFGDQKGPSHYYLLMISLESNKQFLGIQPKVNLNPTRVIK